MCIRDRLDKQDKVDEVLFEKVDNLHRDFNRETQAIKKGCERDIRMVDERLRLMEKKMWSIAGGLTIVSFLVSPIGQRFIRPLTEQPNTANMVHSVSLVDVDRQSVRI